MFFDLILNSIYPSQCPVCYGSSDSYKYNPLCVKCWSEIKKYDGPACKICGVPSISKYTIFCGSCQKTPPPFTQIIYYGLYEGNLRKAIHLFKFSRIKRLATQLGRLLIQLSIPKADFIIPVPLHIKRLREREFNQTALLGNVLAKELGIKLLLNELIKIKETIPQTSLNREERMKEVKNVFVFNSNKIRGCDILLVDDVITSGATVRECSRVLEKAGAKNVTVLALAHSVPADLNN